MTPDSHPGNDRGEPFLIHPVRPELRLNSGRHELCATADAIFVDGHAFTLAGVERVAYRASTSINQAGYLLRLSQDGRTATFSFDAYRRGTELEEAAATWDSLTFLVRTRICPRIADRMVSELRSGRTVTVGGAGGTKIDADRQGLRLRRAFLRKTPWSEIVTADLGAGAARVWTVAEWRNGAKPRMAIDMFGWNAVVLPHLVARLAEGEQ